MSSYDVGVWFSPADLSDAQAADYYGRLGHTVVVVEHRPEFSAFLRELTARFPDRALGELPVSADAVPLALLMTWDDLKAAPPRPPTPAQIARMENSGAVFDASPWGASLSANGDTTKLPFGWNRVDAVMPVVIAMARRHGLTVYDPQTGKVTNPSSRRSKQDAVNFLTVHLTLRLEGQPPAVNTTLIQDGRTVLHTILPDRAAAHALARRVALERHGRAYEVVDPRSLAQGTRLVPLPPENNRFSGVLDGLRRQGIDAQFGVLEGPDGPVK